MSNGVGLHLVVGPLVADWSWGSLQPGPGVLRLSHSQRGHTVCDPGQQHISQVNDTCIPQTTGVVLFQHLRTLDIVVYLNIGLSIYKWCMCELTLQGSKFCLSATTRFATGQVKLLLPGVLKQIQN